MKKIIQLALGLLLSSTVGFSYSEAFKPNFVDTLVVPYLAIQQGLAEDDLEAAKAGANSFLEAIKGRPHQGDARKEAAELSAPAKAIAESSVIMDARAAFLSLSGEVTSLVQQIGTTRDVDLYIAHCPMAFNNKGGSWMQSDKTVANPYYGSMMLRCGTIQKHIADQSPDKHRSHE